MSSVTTSSCSTGATTTTTEAPATPLLARFPGLAALPRAALTAGLPSPLVRLPDEGMAAGLWLKRDDLDAPLLGGNKVRALEWLLGDVRAGDTLLTAGGRGSTHVLATATHAARLGARTVAVRWPHDMHPVAERVAEESRRRCAEVVDAGSLAAAFAIVVRRRLAARVGGRTLRWIPVGGSTAAGALGHVNAALELAEQIARGELPVPARIVVPLGSAGTAAGLLAGLAIAGLPTEVIAVRVVPRIAAGPRRTLRLAHAAAALIEQHAGGRSVPRARGDRLTVVHDAYAGAYGRPLARGAGAAALLHAAAGVALDATYSEKAAAVALDLLARDRRPTLLWLTFDARWLTVQRAAA